MEIIRSKEGDKCLSVLKGRGGKKDRREKKRERDGGDQKRRKGRERGMVMSK